MPVDAADGRDSPWQLFRSGVVALDLVLLLAVPVVLVGVMALPRATRVTLAFEYVTPSPWTAFVSSFVHLSGSHLLINLIGYALVVPLAYVLSVVSGYRHRFWVVFVSLLVASPIVLSYLNLTIVRRTATVGFSGVLLALYGYLPVAMASYADERLDLDVQQTVAPLVFFVGVSLVTALTLAAVLTNPVSVPVRGTIVPVTVVLAGVLAQLLLALSLVVVLYTVSVGTEIEDSRPSVKAILDRPGDAELGILAIGVFLTIPFATFPVDPIVDGGVLNGYSHLVGYALGFVATYVAVTIETRVTGEIT